MKIRVRTRAIASLAVVTALLAVPRWTGCLASVTGQWEATVLVNGVVRFRFVLRLPQAGVGSGWLVLQRRAAHHLDGQSPRRRSAAFRVRSYAAALDAAIDDGSRWESIAAAFACGISVQGHSSYGGATQSRRPRRAIARGHADRSGQELERRDGVAIRRTSAGRRRFGKHSSRRWGYRHLYWLLPRRPLRVESFLGRASAPARSNAAVRRQSPPAAERED